MMPFGWPRVHYRELPSTMPLMAELARQGAPHGAVVMADYQTAGTGRAGRAWVAPPRSALLVSVLLRTRQPLARVPVLSLVTAAAVATIAEAFGAADVRIKWPNDVLIAGRKVSGILLRTHPLPGAADLAVVAGIGLNLSPAAAAGIPHATSLDAACGRTVAREAVLERLLAELGALVAAFEAGRDRALLAAVAGRLAWRGETVVIADGDRTVTGVLAGLDDTGGLLIDLPRGERVAIMAGELQRGPVRAESPG